MRSAHLFPCIQVAVGGSADMAFLPCSSESRLENSLIEKSLDLSRSCIPDRACCDTDGFLRCCFLSRRIGGNDVYLPVGDGNIDGSNSRAVG